MPEVLNVVVREQRGTRAARRLRKAGQTPAVLYGHGEEVVSLTIPTEQIETAIRRGQKLVDLQGGVSDTALIRDVQWDTFGSDVLHLDLTRVSAGESVELSIPVELRGEAPGVQAGGMLEHMLHEVTINVPVVSIPEKLQLRINSLEVGGSFTAGDLVLPEGATLITPAEATVVQCVEIAPELDDEEEGPSDGSEPEVIGGRPGEEGEE